jgi:hypothetical protein
MKNKKNDFYYKTRQLFASNICLVDELDLMNGEKLLLL